MTQDLTITEPVLIIRVNKLFHDGISATELYEITRGVWKVAEPRRSSVEYAFSVYDGLVKEVYKVNTWHPALSTPYKSRSEKGITLNGGISMERRSEFIGEVAKSEVREKYLDRSVAFLFSKSAANPVKYINC
ncbi:MAG: hypothetical protein DRQ54_10660 [Gammaproteobacteria bacterium]|nr:MAG: hypothetical protein DRQ54_10660 [Gammaproteobacteria bacterium]